MQIKIVALNARFTHSCLALFHVRNELEINCPGVETELCQLTINDSYYETLLRLSYGKPDYIFFSAAVWNSERVEQLILDLKQCLPECGVVVGGPQAVVIGQHLTVPCTVVSGDMEALSATFYRDLESKRLQTLYGGSFLRMDKCLLKRTSAAIYKTGTFITRVLEAAPFPVPIACLRRNRECITSRCLRWSRKLPRSLPISRPQCALSTALLMISRHEPLRSGSFF